jgi:hypothetical protein
VINDAVGSSDTSSTTVNVANATLAASIAPITGGTEGVAWSGKIASFTDANASASAADFTATVNWGDGTTSAGTIAANGSGGFNVTGGHTWTSGGVKPVSVTITGAGGGTANAAGSTTVARKGITGSSGGYLTGTRGVSLTSTIAFFADPNLTSSPSDFTATINWGDGTTSTGVVSRKSATVLRVVGTHTYATAALYTATVTVTDVDGDHTSATTTLKIYKPAVAGRRRPSRHQRHLSHVVHAHHASLAIQTSRRPNR